MNEESLHPDPEFETLLAKAYTILTAAQQEKSKITTHQKHMTSRNARCPCGSGAKFKKCCGNLAVNHSLIDQGTAIAATLRLNPCKEPQTTLPRLRRKPRLNIHPALLHPLILSAFPPPRFRAKP